MNEKSTDDEYHKISKLKIDTTPSLGRSDYVNLIDKYFEINYNRDDEIGIKDVLNSSSGMQIEFNKNCLSEIGSSVVEPERMTDLGLKVKDILKTPEWTQRKSEPAKKDLVDTIHKQSISIERLTNTNEKLVNDITESNRRYEEIKLKLDDLNKKLDELKRFKISRFEVSTEWLEKDLIDNED